MGTKVVLLSRPVWIALDNDDDRDIVEVQGFIVKHDTNTYKIDDYTDYLAGIFKWQSEGGFVKGDLLETSGGKTYHVSDPYIVRYLSKARRQLNIRWLCFETSKELDSDTPGIIGNCFITSRDLYNNILEYGAVVDVDVRNYHRENFWESRERGNKPLRKNKKH